FKIVDFCGYVAVERPNSLSVSHSAADLEAIRTFDEACVHEAGLSESAREAFAEHLRATTDRWALARALEIRRAEGVGPALRFLAQRPGNASYVASKLLQARTERLRRRLGGLRETQRSRHLIG